jgi:hypothetical protein
VLVWAAVYAVLGVVACVVVLARREPTIVRGDWVFLSTALFALLAVVVTTLRGGRFSLGVLAGTIAVLVAAWGMHSRWWVIGVEPSAVLATIEECASRLCAPAARDARHCTVTIPGDTLRLSVVPAGQSTMIVFRSSARHRKAHLFRRLLAKQYRSVMPTIRLGMPGASRTG